MSTRSVIKHFVIKYAPVNDVTVLYLLSASAVSLIDGDCRWLMNGATADRRSAVVRSSLIAGFVPPHCTPRPASRRAHTHAHTDTQLLTSLARSGEGLIGRVG